MRPRDPAYQAAVRVVVRELFDRCAKSQGLVPPPGVLPGPAADPALVAELRETVASYDVGSIEQFGSAYETLLDAQDRKHSGAHYTPRELADEVVVHALAPLVADRAPEDLLGLRILDIATGSGIFLLAAAHHLVGLHPDGPSLREVVSTCLYGADVNLTTVEVCRLSLWLVAGDQRLPLDFLDDRIRHGDSLVEAAGIGDRIPVDWSACAPEVMAAGGFDAVIGNPPFLGVKSIRGAVGQEVRDHYARTLLGGESGRSDLVVFFVARAALLSAGVVALVVPDAISEGDSSRFGLGRALAAGFRLYRAETSRPWPGAAGVRIALIWMRRSEVDLEGVLDGEPVASIGPSLGRAEVRHQRRLLDPPAWIPPGHQATIVLGRSLLLTRAGAAELVAADPRIAPWVRDYLSGEDLVSAPGSVSSRCVLDLGGVELATLEDVPALAGVLAEVRAERAGQVARYPQLAGRWWGFLSPVDRLYESLAGESEAIAFSKHAKYIWPVLVATGPVFSNGTVVYPTADRGVYAFLASTPHRLWAVDHGGSRLNQSFRYNPSRLRRTYPFPDSVESARDAGDQLAVAVTTARTALEVGITDLLNLVHGPGSVPPEIEGVRAAVTEVDRAVLAAHGIDAPVVHAVRVEADRTWFGPDPAAEAAIRARLLD
ncbi:MAG: N-6 DNA methylase [Propionibacteriales bacterium]|nr:N-6 DNA methylase [Propionibacteriales bacterium]